MVAASTSSGRVSLTSSRAARPGRGAAQAADAHGHQAAVLVEQRHDVGHGADRDDVEVRPQGERQLDAVGAAVFEQRVGQLEGHADPGQMRERIASQFGVDDNTVGDPPDRLVVIGDDHVEAELTGTGDLGVGADPAVDGDDEAGAGAGELVERLDRDAVALAGPVGQPP